MCEAHFGSALYLALMHFEGPYSFDGMAKEIDQDMRIRQN